MKRFLIALQFLTIIPVRISSGIEEKDFGKALIYFPVVGALIGVVLAAAAFLFTPLPNLVAGALILILSVVITGGIHLDGFSDTCDGFYGYHSKEKILEIMRDSRIGTMAVIGVVSLLLLKFSIIATLARHNLWKALIMMAVFSRWSQVMACYMSEYVRMEGKAKYFIEHAGYRELLIGALVTLGVFLLLLHIKGAILFFIAIPAVILLINYIKIKIGGMTGDTIGAVSEVSEVLILFLSLL